MSILPKFHKSLKTKIDKLNKTIEDNGGAGLGNQTDPTRELCLSIITSINFVLKRWPDEAKGILTNIALKARELSNNLPPKQGTNEQNKEKVKEMIDLRKRVTNVLKDHIKELKDELKEVS